MHLQRLLEAEQHNIWCKCTRFGEILKPVVKSLQFHIHNLLVGAHSLDRNSDENLRYELVDQGL